MLNPYDKKFKSLSQPGAGTIFEYFISGFLGIGLACLTLLIVIDIFQAPFWVLVLIVIPASLMLMYTIGFVRYHIIKLNKDIQTLKDNAGIKDKWI